MDDKKLCTRVREVLSVYKYSITMLANGNDSQRVKLTRQINGDVSIQVDTIMLILETFPNISAEWLMRGDGTIYKMDHERTHAQTDHPMPQPPTADKKPECADDLVALQKDAIIQRDKQIALMESMIAMLRAGH